MTAMSGDTPEKHEIAYACGHFEIRVKSKRDISNAFAIRAAARRVCETCLARHKAMRVDMISNSAQRTKEALLGTTLTGSKKQIDWAARIREKWLYIVKRDIPSRLLNSIFEKAQSSSVSPDAVEQCTTNVLAVRLTAIDEVLAHGNAAWWIDFRDYLDSMVNNPTDEAIRSEFPDRTRT
jgi:hypothetical protein